ncbi:putative D-xylose utilization operon transcriptional repressor [Methylobacterium crusticola]|uniref:D-xylose utilization operon transcriptional repressor n=1 Tax=Methylobacterium crusticola TaxID=1697972 RepID=A0ABQ4QRA2_9HYPH|nr:GntR family transcriptional regulator [Methylobacterium crusticola]GJD47808.1 putative D-xylose utilization operon transcriptional repressor [Methylobacterium crusticola]
MPKSAALTRSAGSVPEAGTKVSAPAMVREGLRRAIVSGEYASGTQLRQDELAERFGTSRIPVREALRQLEAEGLVTIEANKGATVTALSLQEVLELLDIRIALECRALQLAIPNMIDGDFDAAEEILQGYSTSEDPTLWGEANWRFHSVLYAPCARPKLLAMIESNYGHVGRFTRLNVSRAAGKDRPLREHWELLNHCRSGAVEKATALLEEHIAYSQKSLAAATRQPRWQNTGAS